MSGFRRKVLRACLNRRSIITALITADYNDCKDLSRIGLRIVSDFRVFVCGLLKSVGIGFHEGFLPDC